MGTFNRFAFSVFAIIAFAMFVLPADAKYIYNVYQSGADVIAAGSGTIDLTDLTFGGGGVYTEGSVDASIAQIGGGPTGFAVEKLSDFMGLQGPASFGNGGYFADDAYYGDQVQIIGQYGELRLDDHGGDYFGSTIFTDTTIEALGLDPGTYTYTWGSGVDADSIIVNIAQPTTGVPEPFTLSLFGAGLAGAVALRRRKKARKA